VWPGDVVLLTRSSEGERDFGLGVEGKLLFNIYDYKFSDMIDKKLIACIPPRD
jgi:hypothetical protein